MATPLFFHSDSEVCHGVALQQHITTAFCASARLYDLGRSSVQVMVVVAQSNSFRFVYPDHQDQEEPLPGPSVRRLLVASQSGATVLVPVQPLLLGLMPVSVMIKSIAGAQRLYRTVLVKVRQKKTERERGRDGGVREREGGEREMGKSSREKE